MSAPIQRTKLYEDVADRILERVRAGTWPAGSRLPAEGELAEEFDVSRSTVRAAVRSLRIAGVLQPRNGSGTYVTAQAQMILDTRELAAVMGDPARIRDLVETRYVLEPQVAALAALRASEAEKSALLADVARMEEKQDRPSLMALGYAFHQRLAQRFECGARKLGQLVEEQHAVVCQTYLAGLVGGATANEGHVGYGVMGRTEGAAGYE